MRSYNLLVAQTVGERVGRSGLAFLALTLAYVSVSHSLARVIVKADPEIAHALAPNDGQITAALAEKRFVEGKNKNSVVSSAQLAREALLQDPTVVPAVVTLGLQAQIRGDKTQARRLLAYSEKLSRRDLQTQIWALEDSVARNDIPGTLRHYDIALRTSKEAEDLLFPVLSSAVADADIRAGLIAVLDRQPFWSPRFIRFVADNAQDPHSVMELYKGLRLVGSPPSVEADTVVINRLVAAGALNDAWEYYESTGRGNDRRRSRDSQFSANLAFPSVLDWLITTGNDVNASIGRSGSGGVFDFDVPTGRGGSLLQQVQMLTPGRYRIEGRSRGIDQPDSALPYWMLSCIKGGEIGRVTVSRSSHLDGKFFGQLIVPKNCASQVLELVARPSDSANGVVGEILLFRLLPIE